MSEVTLNPLKCALDEAQALRGQVDALQAENAKLKTDVERMFQANVEKNNEVLELLGDNAKLRELVRKLVGLDSLYEVPMYNVNEWSRRMDSIHDEMRELGVEVDDG